VLEWISMHESHEHHQHIPPPDPSIEKKPRRFKPIHVVIGGLILVAILLIYIFLIARAGY
jgi:hypothetical protein